MLPALMNCGPRLCIIPMSIAPTNAPLAHGAEPADDDDDERVDDHLIAERRAGRL